MHKKSPATGAFNRDGQIRTDDILLPKQTLYQTELHPASGANIIIRAAFPNR